MSGAENSGREPIRVDCRPAWVSLISAERHTNDRVASLIGQEKCEELLYVVLGLDQGGHEIDINSIQLRAMLPHDVTHEPRYRSLERDRTTCGHAIQAEAQAQDVSPAIREAYLGHPCPAVEHAVGVVLPGCPVVVRGSRFDALRAGRKKRVGPAASNGLGKCLSGLFLQPGHHHVTNRYKTGVNVLHIDFDDCLADAVSAVRVFVGTW
jgi:hypothetical protein